MLNDVEAVMAYFSYKILLTVLETHKTCHSSLSHGQDVSARLTKVLTTSLQYSRYDNVTTVNRGHAA